ncbi:MAG: 3-keto-disaccharide hydrolase [Planctomycetota bacterium]
MRTVPSLRLNAWLLPLLVGFLSSPVFESRAADSSNDADGDANRFEFVELFNGRDLTGWVDVNTSPDTWKVKDGLLVCSGKPIGVMRSEKQYENFILHIEWRHMEAGGNSGVFVWSEGFVPEGKRLPKGMEVQMLELDWINQHRTADGEPRHVGYISGELFGANGLTATPDNPRGNRSMSRELRCKGKGEWNTYDVVCVDGTVKLAINGRFVNSIRDSSVRKGYLCLESEGSEIHFRNIRILELPPGITTPEQTAKVLE